MGRQLKDELWPLYVLAVPKSTRSALNGDHRFLGHES